MTPLVTFVVPCYKLAHYLAECVDSILAQTYENFEVLIMDDCSPDHTAEVARGFRDPRVKHIRNEPNLGHLRNYNKGIEMARGKYVWLISADDRLRAPHALSRYVEVMESHPKVAYACCSAVEIRSGQETGTAKYSLMAPADSIFNGHQLLKRLLYANTIVAPSGMVRKSCYEAHGVFPLDLPYAGDWYLWCLFALHHDAAFFAEPMVAYRMHDQSMTEALVRENIRVCADNDLAVLWRIESDARTAGHRGVAALAVKAICRHCAEQMMRKRYRNGECLLTPDELEKSLDRFGIAPRRKPFIRAGVHASMGDLCFETGARETALGFYLQALRENRWLPKVWAKAMLLRTGRLGTVLRGDPLWTSK